jgi:hypothetical protein
MLKTPQPNCEVYHIYNPVRSSDEEKQSFNDYMNFSDFSSHDVIFLPHASAEYCK